MSSVLCCLCALVAFIAFSSLPKELFVRSLFVCRDHSTSRAAGSVYASHKRPQLQYGLTEHVEMRRMLFCWGDYRAELRYELRNVVHFLLL